MQEAEAPSPPPWRGRKGTDSQGVLLAFLRAVRSLTSGMTKSMTYEQKYQELDQRIRSVQRLAPLQCRIRDGIVAVERWRLQDIRPLFIGKEAYEKSGSTSWAIHDLLNNAPQALCFARSHRTWQTTAYVSFGLQNGLMPFRQMPRIQNDSSLIDALRSIAFINVGKYGAKITTPWQRLHDLYRQNRTVLQEQIELFQPNVLIGWSTLGLFQNDTGFANRLIDEQQRTSQDAVDSWVVNGKLYIDAYHPVYRGVNRERYVNSIMAAVKEHKDSIDFSLPSV